ncbi:MAG TPA: arginine--tRNA ligase, partial [Verrucomicrobiales bacterium]|nr:arginine--tRNA ligase [Euryarchaeota archaeon]HAO96524.1 arginine--tRNA ligase [Verrucomicrobiales bacterium]
ASLSHAADLRFGDYQSNVAMVLSKSAKRSPRDLAEALKASIEVGDIGEVEIAGPGFLNFQVSAPAYAKRLSGLMDDDRLGVEPVENPRRIVIDFSAPNVAKPMHVGHLRSTFIGDSLARIGRFLGHDVISDNHIGDWGTQFGMVIWAWKRSLDRKSLEDNPLNELLRLYRAASERCGEDDVVREECRKELVALQQGDEENLSIWRECVSLSREGLEVIYDRLGVSFDHWLGESSYNDRLSDVVDDLVEEGLARESDGAMCVFSAGLEDPGVDPFKIQKDGDWEDKPMIVRKSDGGFNYATTDIATVDYRLEELRADAAWYVVDHRQGDHFKQLFAVAARRGCRIELEHVSFGTILGKDGKPLKTRSGDLPLLSDLLDDAVEAARKSSEGRSRVEKQEERDALAELIGISAIKFMELSHHRTSDYIFDLDKMVSMDGDTAPYLQYSYVRCRSIFAKMGGDYVPDGSALELSEERELHLARMLVRFGEIVPIVLEGFRPNFLAGYLLELARAYHSFFQSCPVLKSEGVIRDTRLALCELTARVLRQGLELLGIEVPERM